MDQQGYPGMVIPGMGENGAFPQFEPTQIYPFDAKYFATEDYKTVVESLQSLRAQYNRLLHERELLQQEKAMALADPASYAESLVNGVKSLPTRQEEIVVVPTINLEQYMIPLQQEPGADAPSQSETEHKSDKGASAESGWQDLDEQRPQNNGKKRKNQPPTRPWSPQEHEKLQMLLEKYPETLVEAHRWENIARELGTRTPKQVASRVSKYFLKLAKAGLPVPGRVPKMPNDNSKKRMRTDNGNTNDKKISIHTTDLEYYKPPPVTMPNETQLLAEEGNMDVKGICELAGSKEYKQLLELLHMRQQQEREKRIKPTDAMQSYVHLGYKCDGCGTEPIVGSRWKCLECPDYRPIDLCNDCHSKGWSNSYHTHHHKLDQITQPTYFMDQDYARYQINEETEDGTTSYLDPTFMPM
eukprot:TRINITY_DN8296_c0_g1_i1.p2 TRINITY_DN8296_c0_g1~~TRINITY_DN8296_c0_g1_i1.p2  ORF type:complete len:425 (-),score=67.06 TRINITY_DN8296_c0_g1_i1:1350-2591(-)